MSYSQQVSDKLIKPFSNTPNLIKMSANVERL